MTQHESERYRVRACLEVDDGDDGSVRDSVGEAGRVVDLREGEGRENAQQKEPPTS
jgi:hypothetical protein